MTNVFESLLAQEVSELPTAPPFETPVRVQQVLVRDPNKEWTIADVLAALSELGWHTESSVPLKIVHKVLAKGCAKGWAQRVSRDRYRYREAVTA